jgi:DNA-binding transcriptional MerR regulator
MAVIYNETARLLVGPQTKKHAPPRWIPGRNPLDSDYWAEVEEHPAIKAWTGAGWLRVSQGEEMPDPTSPPTREELEGFSLEDLRKALSDTDVPVQWRPMLREELDRRKKEQIEKRLPKTPEEPSKERASVTGMRVEDALPLIAAETDVAKLVAWADADHRKRITEAIDKRIAEIEGDGC